MGRVRRARRVGKRSRRRNDITLSARWSLIDRALTLVLGYSASNKLGLSKDVGTHPPGDSITSPVPYNAEAMVLVAITSTACGPSMLCGEM